MTYPDAKEYLRIADNAYNAEAYTEAAEILEKVVHAVAFDRELSSSRNRDLSSAQYEEIAAEVRRQIARFHFCPDEPSWEDVSSLLSFLP